MASSVVFLIITNGSVEFADWNVAVSTVAEKSPTGFKAISPSTVKVRSAAAASSSTVVIVVAPWVVV